MKPALDLPKLTATIPGAIWVPSGSLKVYRGSPVEVVRQMVGCRASRPFQARPALQGLTEELAKARRVRIHLPWEAPDEVLSALFLHALLQLRIARPVPAA
jgi:hypothetical protein